MMNEAQIEQALRTGYDHFTARRFEEAERMYRQVLAEQPNNPDGLQLLGLVAGETNRVPLGIELLNRVIAMHPKVPRLHWTVGDFYGRTGNWKFAVEAYRKAMELKPEDAETMGKLGAALKQVDQHDEAIAVLKKSLEMRPENYVSMINLGAVYTETGRFDDAVAILRKAVALNPYAYEGHVNLGSVLKAQSKVDEAISVLQHAVSLNPNSPEGFNNLGAALLMRGALDEAADAFRRSVQLSPQGAAPALHNLAITLKDQGALEEALATHDRALAMDPGNAVYHSNRLFTLHLDPKIAPERVLEEHQKYNRFVPEGPRTAHLNERLPQRKLKIGYVSPDFRKHAVSFFLLPLLNHHDRTQFHVTCYASSPVKDEVTEKIAMSVDAFKSIVAMSHDQAAELIRQDEIDVLIDLAGHTANSRLLTFARKPAPVQMTWLGYPGSTGLSTMDYRISDGYADPEGMTDPPPAYSSEKILRLPQTAWCFHPLSGSPAVGELPAKKNGYVTFGTFNNFSKISRVTLGMWGRILRGAPNSRLLLKNNSMKSEAAKRKVREFLEAEGISPERVELVTWTEEFDEHLLTYNRVDIGLDTFPYHGTTTTCEALWMGVPVVTLAGQTHASRVGVSLLTNAGLGQLVAKTPEEYVKLATELAGDLESLAGLRSGLRGHMTGSPMMNGKSFALGFEGAIRTAWRGWCGR